MTTETLTLSAWLLKRIADDEAAAKAIDESWYSFGSLVGTVVEGLTTTEQVVDAGEIWLAKHIATHDPARVLATCAAHRAIVEFAADATGLDLQVDGEFGVGRRDEADDPYLGDQILRALASIYADREGWREEWAL